MLHIGAEGNQTCQRGDEGAHATDVDAKQKLRIISRELGEENGGGNVADYLTGKNGYQKGAMFE